MSSYSLVYDARNEPVLDWSSVAVYIVMAIAWVVFWALGRKRWSRTDTTGEHSPGWFGAMGVVGLVLITAAGMLTVALNLHQHRLLARALDQGTYTLVEGTVQDFVPGDREAHWDERWTVQSGGRVYAYAYRSSFDIPGFNRSAGPIREGLRVRVSDVRGYIARLEVEDPAGGVR